MLSGGNGDGDGDDDGDDDEHEDRRRHASPSPVLVVAVDALDFCTRVCTIHASLPAAVGAQRHTCVLVAVAAADDADSLTAPVVANSGGPDSTCLLFLLARYARTTPTRILSWSLDHGLQPASARWLAHTARAAAALGVPHTASTLSWRGTPPAARLELAARDARYAQLYAAMCAARAPVAALGHHADDQVETAVLRALRGSSERGLAGMAPCRRFGMGERGELGPGGMRRWIVRPLLPVSKDRILATCDAHGLDYVVDATNFQPELTLRNAIRQAVKDRDPSPVRAARHLTSPAHPRAQISRFDPSLTTAVIASRLSTHLDISQGAPALRDAVRELGRRAEALEDATTAALRLCTLPSPPGTLVLAANVLRALAQPRSVAAPSSLAHPHLTPLAQRALITRALRFASPHPFGTLRAEAGRHGRSLARIAERVFGEGEAGEGEGPGRQPAAPFSAGADVLWTP
ncbi:PP-loop family-domain-containing protein, partial [Schizophyllum fasciatum]